MATAVQSALQNDPHRQYHQRNPPQPQALYTVCIPTSYGENSGSQNSIYKQINIIPGFDPENAVVDTGVKLVRPLGTQVQLPTSTGVNEYDGKRMRRSIQRRTVDYNASVVQQIKHRLFRRSILQKPVSQPDPLYYPELIQPSMLLQNPMNSVTTRFVRASTNKVRCPVFSVAWTPEGRRVVTGTSSGEFTLWNGLTFNFETILQAHESSVRAMEWSHNDMWLLSGDHSGVIKYWQSNMNNVKMMQAHTDPIRGVGFCPTDNKFVTCSDDGLIKLWDFYRCHEERVLRGHGADVKCVGWHPFKSLVASGSKDSQQPLKLWDPRTGASLATIHGHKSTVMDLHWNKNGNWLLTGSRDRLLKVFDIRVMKEIYTFRGHKKEAASVNWHPLYESMFASGGSDGSIMYWLMGCEKELGVMENAHDGMIWDLQWHPLGHILCSGSNDHTTKFWTRNRPGDKMRDKYNLNVLPMGYDDDYEYELPNNCRYEEPVLDEQSINMSIDTPAGEGETSSEDLLNNPAVQALLQHATLHVQKPSSKERPAQIYTVSRQRSNAPKFKIDTSKQRRALDEVERLEKRRERQLTRGRPRDMNNAPSLLDLDIVPPPYIAEHDWEEKDAPYSEEMNDDVTERPTANGMQQNWERHENASNERHMFEGRAHKSFARANQRHHEKFNYGPRFDEHQKFRRNEPNFPAHTGNFERRFDERMRVKGPERIEEPRNFKQFRPQHGGSNNNRMNGPRIDRYMDSPMNGPYRDGPRLFFDHPPNFNERFQEGNVRADDERWGEGNIGDRWQDERVVRNNYDQR